MSARATAISGIPLKQARPQRPAYLSPLALRKRLARSASQVTDPRARRLCRTTLTKLPGNLPALRKLLTFAAGETHDQALDFRILVRSGRSGREDRAASSQRCL